MIQIEQRQGKGKLYPAFAVPESEEDPDKIIFTGLANV